MGKVMQRLGALFAAVSLFITNTPIVHAHCPLCTGAVIAGAVGAKYIGLDVSIVGIFTGAFAISTGIWVGKKIRQLVPYQVLWAALLSFALTIIPLLGKMNEPAYIPVFLFGTAGSLFNRLYFVDKFLLGSAIGGIVTAGAYWVHLSIKARNGKVLFPFQGIALTVTLLIMASIPMYFLFR